MKHIKRSRNGAHMLKSCLSTTYSGVVPMDCKKLSKDAFLPIYKKLYNGDYILQPKFMLDSGSMCVTELYSKQLKVKLIHELLFKERMEAPLPRLEKPKLRKDNDEKFKSQELLRKIRKKTDWGNRELIKYEKRHLCPHKNTDGSGTLLRNESENTKLLKTSIYLRGKEFLKRINDKNEVLYGEHKIKKRYKTNIPLINQKYATIVRIKDNRILKDLMKTYEDSLETAQKSLK